MGNLSGSFQVESSLSRCSAVALLGEHHPKGSKGRNFYRCKPCSHNNFPTFSFCGSFSTEQSLNTDYLQYLFKCSTSFYYNVKKFQLYKLSSKNTQLHMYFNQLGISLKYPFGSLLSLFSQAQWFIS